MRLFSKQEELLLLSVFSLKDNAYLVSIREYLLNHASKDWAFGSLYVGLDRLKKDGYVETFIGTPSSSRGGKAIKFYKLTEQGVKSLMEAKKVNDSMWQEFSDYATNFRETNG